MKTILVVLVSIFVLMTSCVAIVTEGDVPVPKWTEDNSKLINDDDYANTQEEEGDDNDELVQDKDATELEENLNNEDVGLSLGGEGQDSQSQDIRLRFNHGKGTTLTLTPNGGTASTTYTRWGRWSCPHGATKVYDGYASAGWYNQKGNGANYLCMPKNPQYLSTQSVPWPSCLYGAEYESNNRIFGRRTQNYNVPCAVCHVPRSAKLMIPGRVACPSSWKREYYGYLMTGHMNNYQTLNYECVDVRPDILPGTKSNTNGALFYFLRMECGYGIPCHSQAYIKNRPITCAICTK